MDAAFQSKLLSEGVYALPVFAVESLYYAPEVIAAVAKRQGETLKIDSDTLVAAAKEKALSTLRQTGKVEHLAARVAERQMRDQLLEAMPGRADMIASGENELSVSLQSPYPTTLRRAQRLLQENDLASIVAGFPVRESGILSDIAHCLRFIGDADYEKAALAAISIDPDLASSVRSKLGILSERLQ